MDNAETAAAYVGNGIPFFQHFTFAQPGKDAVKMNRRPGAFIGHG
jgi:hypothetical protein